MKINRGTYIFPDDNGDIRWIGRSRVIDLPGLLKRLYKGFCILKRERVGCPKSFNQLTVSWYLNSSRYPNVAANENFNFCAIKDIEEGGS